MHSSLRIAFYTLIASLTCVTATLHAQTLSGTITDENGNPLAFATVYIPDRQSGTACNEDGLYSIRLGRGTHTIIFQYLGYKTVEERVQMRDDDIVLDISLELQPVELEGVTVSSDREDPAYTIMRKAIAKAKYHTQQIDSFSANVYIKGSGRLKGIPGLFRKQIEKALAEDGLDTTTAFTIESVSELEFKRPNQYRERVISVRAIGDDNNTSPGSFVQSSFYEPEVNGSVSPLSPRAFAYYRFEFLGEFTDRGHTVNKIRVTPRSRGDNVFEGTLYIVDQLWSVHSLDLDTYIWGILFNVNQVYAPIIEKVWMPVNQIYNVSGKVFGFSFEYLYLANLSNHQVFINEELPEYFDVIDDKIEKDLAKQADANIKESYNDPTIEKLASGEEVSRKELRKMLKEYEKQERQKFESDTLTDVVQITDYKVDTMAYKRDSIYWQDIRPIPLTKYEVKGYRVQDSMSVVYAEQEEAAADSVSVEVGSGVNVSARKRSAFQVQDLILGGDYKISEGGTRLALISPLLRTHYNTVDGFLTGTDLRLYNSKRDGLSWSITPTIRYAFSRKQVNYNLSTRFTWGERFEKWALVAEGGIMPYQLNRNDPINPYVNDFMTLLFEQNYMKIFEREYALVGLQKDINPKYRLSLELEYAQSKQLQNTSTFKIFNNDNHSFTSNVPYNAEIGDTDFPQYRSATVQFGLRLRPWSRFTIRNGRKRIKDETTPTFTVNFKAAIPGIADSEVDYSLLDIAFDHVITFPAGGVLNLNVDAGMFLHNNSMYFPEFKHFMGSQVPFATTDPVSAYRALEYYTYSTQDKYLTLHAFYQFRKLLATQLLEVRLAGIKEGMFFSLLETPSSNHYFEIGYGLNYIFRFLRFEVATSWQDWKYQNLVFRVGIAANFETLFN